MPTLQTNPLRALLGLPDDPNYPQNPLASLGDNQAPNLVDYFRQAESSRNPGHNAGIDARATAQEARDKEQADKENEALIAQLPDVSAEADKGYQEKLGLARAEHPVTDTGNLAIEQAKAAAAAKAAEQEQQNTRDLISSQNGGTNGAPGNSPFKMSITANGKPTFAPNPMPALVQRAHAQLSEAHDQHLEALQEAERLWPGINKEAQGADQGAAPGLMSSLGKWLGAGTGIGAPKFGGPGDAAALASETMRYRARQSTPLSNFIQKSSFGNLEQMAGQLPGVRGLATVVPLFKEHQTALTSNNPGTPLSNVQRLRHLIDSEESALEEMTHSTEQP